MQSKLTEAVNLEKESQVWKRIRDDLPAGQLSFILRAASDTLPTPLNLRRWKIQCRAKCSLCGNSRPTVAHILNGCSVALEQGRYTWRHDCVLSTSTSMLRSYLSTETTIYADLPNQRATEHPPSTIPPSILVTPLKPDLVLLYKDKQATVIELTCPMNTKSNLVAARSRKQNKEVYGILFSDMANQGWTVDYETLEIGSLGHYQKEMRPLLSSALDLPKGPTRDLLDRCAKATISCSYQIFLARNSPSWSPPSLLSFYYLFYLFVCFSFLVRVFFLPCLTSLCTCTVRVLCACVREFVTLCMSFQIYGMVFPPPWPHEERAPRMH